MNVMQLAIALVTAVGLAAAAPELATGTTAHATRSQPVPRVEGHFPMPSSALTIVAQGDQAHTMLDVLVELSASANQNITVSEPTRAALKSLSPGLLADVVVPPEEVYSFVSSLLYRHGFVVSELRSGTPSLIAVQGGRERGQSMLYGLSWTRVPLDRIDEFRDHPAFLIETVATFEHLDVRQMTTSLRALMTDNRLQSLLNVGNSNSVIVRGPAAGVADLLALMGTANEENAELVQKRAEEQARREASVQAEQAGEAPAGNPAQAPKAD